MEALYKGVRCDNDAKLSHQYITIPDGRSLYFKKQLPGWHRIGDVLELEEPKPGSFKVKGEVLRHVASPEDEAADTAARQHQQCEVAAKKQSERSDLLEALEPLRRTYRQLPSPQRAALITWVVRTLLGWK